MAREIVGLLVLAGRDCVQLIVETFFVEPDLDAAKERASGDPIDVEFGH
jgi:hypothetical protein